MHVTKFCSANHIKSFQAEIWFFTPISGSALTNVFSLGRGRDSRIADTNIILNFGLVDHIKSFHVQT